MIFGVCAKCKSTMLPVKNGQLVPHMSPKKMPCNWAIAESTKEGLNFPFLNNPFLDFFQNMSAMLDQLEEVS